MSLFGPQMLHLQHIPPNVHVVPTLPIELMIVFKFYGIWNSVT